MILLYIFIILVFVGFVGCFEVLKVLGIFYEKGKW